MNAKQVFLSALENCDPSDWDGYLDEICGDDFGLRNRVADLLKAHTQRNSLLDVDGVFSVNASEQFIERPGMMIGQFKILEEIGEGGFGVIFLCEQQEPIRRRVAVKVLKPGLDSRQVVARFEAERQALAMMEHPNITSVMEAGLAPSGRPYFAMELVQGVPITEYFDEQQLSIPRRLELFIDVCKAVQHAHLKGIIHRDLKPSNILVAQADGMPVVKVIDFGIAKATGSQRLTEKTLITHDLGFVGTPAYMSPEQMARNASDIDTRSDIYALGVLLYETLTGKTPFDSKALEAAGYDEMRRMICDRDPPRPSARIAALPHDEASQAEQNRGVEPNKLPSLLRRELDWIAMKAIEKTPSRRYQSASELANDITSFLNDAPVRACPPSRIYQLQKLASRHKIALITTGLVACALLIGSIVSLWQAQRAFVAMRLADLRLENEKRALAKVMRSESELKRQLYASETAEAWGALSDGDRERSRTLLARSEPEPGKPDFREFSWKLTNAIWNRRSKELLGHDAGILTASLSPNNRLIASGDRKGTVKIWSVETGREIRSWNYSNKEVTTAMFSPDGKTLATAGQDRTIRLWSTADWKEMGVFRGHSLTVCSVSWSPDSSRLASGSRDQSVRIWDVDSGTELNRFEGMSDAVRKVLWTADGSHLIATDGKAIRSWNTENWQQANDFTEHTQGVLSLAASPDGSLVASGGYDAQVIVHDLATRKLIERAITGTSVWSLGFSPDGQHLFAGLNDGGPMIWRIHANGAQMELVRGGIERGGRMRGIEFTSDQSYFMIASEEDKTIRICESRSVFGYDYVSLPEDCLNVDVATGLAICSALDGSVVLRDFTTGSIRSKLVGHNHPAVKTAISNSNRWLATYANDNEVLLWNLHSGALAHRFTLVDNLTSRAPDSVQLEFSPDESLIAAAGALSNSDTPNSVRFWSVVDGGVYRDLCFDAPHSARMGFTSEGDRIAIGVEGRFAVFPVRTQVSNSDPVPTSGQIWQIQYSPDGTQLVTVGDSQGAIAWDAVSLQQRMQFAWNRIFHECFAISPDSQTLATVGKDNALRLWHLPSGQQLGTVLRHSRHLAWIKFASNTKLLVGSKLNEGSPQGVFVFDAGE